MRRLLYIALLVASFTHGTWAGSVSHITTFELNKGFVVVQASVNGQNGAYIVDSGAPGLVLNALRHDIDGTILDLQGIGGSLQGEFVTPVNLAFNQLQYDALDALVIDLTYLEKALDRAIDGLIGLNIFENNGVVIDYATHSIHVVPNTTTEVVKAPHIALPITMEGHIPVVQLESQGQILRFGIDTGSRSNLVSKEILEYLGKYEILNGIVLTGSDQRTVHTDKIEVHTLSALGFPLGATPMIVTDLSATEILGTALDGILGHDFFEGRKVFINADRTVLYVTGAGKDISSSDLFNTELAIAQR